MDLSICNYGVVANQRRNVNFGMSPELTKQANEFEMNLKSRKNEFTNYAQQIKNDVNRELDFANKQDLMLKATKTYGGQIYEEQLGNEEMNLQRNYDISGCLSREQLTQNNKDNLHSYVREQKENKEFYKKADKSSVQIAKFSDKGDIKRVSINESNETIRKHTQNLVHSAFNEAVQEIKEKNILPEEEYLDGDLMVESVPMIVSQKYNLDDGDIFTINYDISGKASRKTLETKDGIVMTENKNGCCSIYFDRKDTDFIGIKIRPKRNTNKMDRTYVIFDRVEK